MKATLKKLSDNTNALRTAEVVGDAPAAPEIGKRFVLYSDPLEIEVGLRYVSTPPVTSVTLEAGGTRFTTENSEYFLETA